jgi:lipopolysaccharide/colanic/teichoic acid biosynthesis glycosyltransferase
MDLLCAVLLLLATAPVMTLVALAVKSTSRGPVLFRQRRPGLNGRQFDILKFRTMVTGVGAPGPAMTLAADPRVTQVGRVMRRWKLDELPQLFNVLRGDMSFVGPRPLPLPHWQRFSMRPEARCIVSVRPGLTSVATLHFLNEEELLASLPRDRIEAIYSDGIMPLKFTVDSEYLASATFASDLRLMFVTALRILYPRKRGADLWIRQRLLASSTGKLAE